MKNTCVKFFVALLLFALPVAAFAQNVYGKDAFHLA